MRNSPPHQIVNELPPPQTRKDLYKVKKHVSEETKQEILSRKTRRTDAWNRQLQHESAKKPSQFLRRRMSSKTLSSKAVLKRVVKTTKPKKDVANIKRNLSKGLGEPV